MSNIIAVDFRQRTRAGAIRTNLPKPLRGVFFHRPVSQPVRIA